MTTRSYTTTLKVEQTPGEVFDAINDVRGWWPEIEGLANRVGGIFEHHFEDMHRCELEVKDLIPGKKIVWTVLENQFSFTKDKNEWKGTDIVFEIARKGTKTELKFTHVGLVPEYECYGVCSNAWDSLINENLFGLITSKPRQA